MAWSDNEVFQFRNKLKGLWPSITSDQQTEWVGQLERFGFASAMASLGAVFGHQERTMVPPVSAVLAELESRGGARRGLPEGRCDYCDGVKGFPMELEVMSLASAHAMGLTREDSRRLRWQSSRTDIPERERHREVVAIRGELWGRWPKITQRIVLRFLCHHCAPPDTDAAFTTQRITTRAFCRLDPKHSLLRHDLERVLKGQKLYRGPPVDGRAIAEDDAMWDDLLQNAADENDRGRHEWFMRCRKHMREHGTMPGPNTREA